MKAHYEAFKTLVEARPLLTGKVFSTIRRTNGEPVRANYVACFVDVPDLDDNRYTSRQARDSKAVYRFDVRVVATSGDGLLTLTDDLLGVIGQVPVVSGRRCDPVTLVPGVEEGKSRYDLTTDLHYIDLSFEFTSRRAT